VVNFTSSVSFHILWTAVVGNPSNPQNIEWRTIIRLYLLDKTNGPLISCCCTPSKQARINMVVLLLPPHFIGVQDPPTQ
jgi:hypothetical protein